MIFRVLWPIFHMLTKEFLEIKRDNILKIAIIIPIIQIFFLGYISTSEMKGLKTMICDEDNTSVSRSLIQKFENCEYFTIKYFVTSPKNIQSAFDKNKIYFCIRIPKKFSFYAKRREKTKIQIIAESALLSFDGSLSFLASAALTKAGEIIGNYSNVIYSKKAVKTETIPPNFSNIKMIERIWYNPELKSQIFFMPGVLGFFIVIVSMIVASFTLVREKESGNMEQILVAPIKPYQIVLGKILLYIFVSLADFLFVTLVSIFLFKLPFRGNVLLFISLSTLMITANLGIGTLISIISSTQRQAMMWDIFLIVLNLILSGFVYPIENIEETARWFSYLIPFRYYLVIIRGVLLKGLSFTDLLPETCALIIFCMIIFYIAIRCFKKTIK